VNSIDVISPAN